MQGWEEGAKTRALDLPLLTHAPCGEHGAGRLVKGNKGTNPPGAQLRSSKAFIKVCNMPTITHVWDMTQAAGAGHERGGGWRGSESSASLAGMLLGSSGPQRRVQGAGMGRFEPSLPCTTKTSFSEAEL